MAARFIVNSYKNKKGNERVSVLMSAEHARLLAVGDRTMQEQLSDAIAKKLEGDSE
jgi:hypothetical protein